MLNITCVNCKNKVEIVNEKFINQCSKCGEIYVNVESSEVITKDTILHYIHLVLRIDFVSSNVLTALFNLFMNYNADTEEEKKTIKKLLSLFYKFLGREISLQETNDFLKMLLVYVPLRGDMQLLLKALWDWYDLNNQGDEEISQLLGSRLVASEENMEIKLEEERVQTIETMDYNMGMSKMYKAGGISFFIVYLFLLFFNTWQDKPFGLVITIAGVVITVVLMLVSIKMEFSVERAKADILVIDEAIKDSPQMIAEFEVLWKECEDTRNKIFGQDVIDKVFHDNVVDKFMNLFDKEG